MTVEGTAFPTRPGVRFPLQPHTDESLAGYIARVAAWNVLDGPNDLLRKVGVSKFKSLSERVSARSVQFAQELGISQNELLRMAVLGASSRSPEVTFFGLRLPRQYVRVQVRNVAPASLALSNHHRATWQVHPISWCAETWDPLIDACPACTLDLTFDSPRGLEYCQACDFDLRRSPVIPLHEDLRSDLEVISRLVSPSAAVRSKATDTLPPPLRDLSPTAALQLLNAAAYALRTGSRSSPTPAEQAEAVRTLQDFPRSFERIADSQADRSVPTRFFLALKSAACMVNSRELSDLAPEILDPYLPPPRGPVATMRQREKLGLLTTRAAATKLGLTRSQLYQLMRTRQLPVVQGWYDPAHVDAAAARLSNRISLTRLEKHYGLPRCGVEQLISLGRLKINTDPMVAMLFPGLQIDRLSLEELLGKLTPALGLPSLHEPATSLVDAFHAVGSQEKPWGSVIEAHVTRRVVGGLTSEPGAPLRFSSLTVSAGFMRELTSRADPELLAIPPRPAELGPPPDFSRTEVERYLNCFPRDVAWLIDAGHLAPRGVARPSFPRDQVTALGDALITSREISWRWRVSPEFRERLHREGIVSRCLGPFWPRVEVTTYFAKLFSNGAPT